MKGRELKRARAALDALHALEGESDVLRRLDLVRRAREALDDLERMHVDACRDEGCTWAEIGRLYGLTKQGAQQRFRTEPAATPRGATKRKHNP